MISERTMQIAKTQWKAYCELNPVIGEAFSSEEPPEGLLEVLADVEFATGGRLRSRQVIAALIVAWVLGQKGDAQCT